MANSPDARSETGELKDVSAPPPAETKPDTGAPETYTDFKLPDGAVLDVEVLGKASPLFKELNLTQDQAQKLVDFYNDINTASKEKLAAVVTEMRTEWRDQVKADKILGPKLDNVITEIGRAKAHLPAEVRSAFESALDITGAGDHPAIVRGFYEMAKLVNEGSHVQGGKPSPEGQTKSGATTPPSLAGAMYPNLPQ